MTSPQCSGPRVSTCRTTGGTRRAGQPLTPDGGAGFPAVIRPRGYVSIRERKLSTYIELFSRPSPERQGQARPEGRGMDTTHPARIRFLLAAPARPWAGALLAVCARPGRRARRDLRAPNRGGQARPGRRRSRHHLVWPPSGPGRMAGASWFAGADGRAERGHRRRLPAGRAAERRGARSWRPCRSRQA